MGGPLVGRWGGSPAGRAGAAYELLLMALLLAGSVGIAGAQESPPAAAAPRQPAIESRTLPSRPGAADAALPPFVVPPVIARPLAEEGGERLAVRGFTVSDALARRPPRLREAVTAVLEAALARQPAAGFTVNEMQLVANDVAAVYSEFGGYMLAQAFVPEQTVADGIIELQVIEGFLEVVRVEDNALFSTRALRRAFARALDRPVRRREIESALLRANDIPGLDLFGVFSPGDAVGGTTLLLRVREERRWSVNAFSDNHGNRLTGEYRALLGVGVNNPFGLLDRLEAFVLQTRDPANTTYGGFSYAVPGSRLGGTFRVGYSINDYSVDSDGLDLELSGHVEVWTTTFEQSLARSRDLSAWARVSVLRKEAEVEQEAVTVFRDALAVLEGAMGYERVSGRLPGVSRAELAISVGVPDVLGAMDRRGCNGDRVDGVCVDLVSSRLAAGERQVGGDFFKLAGRFERLQALGRHQSLLLRAEGQWTPEPLVSLEQFSLGGPDSVRAYPLTEALADRGVFASAELVLDAPFFAERRTRDGRYSWGELFKLSCFIDYGAGRLNQPLDATAADARRVQLLGAGVALQLALPHFAMRLDVAAPLRLFLEEERRPANGREPQYYFRVQYQY